MAVFQCNKIYFFLPSVTHFLAFGKCAAACIWEEGEWERKTISLIFFMCLIFFAICKKKKKRKKSTIASHFLDEGGEKNENQKKLSIGGIWGWKCAHTWMQKNQIFVKKRKLKWIFECFRLILKVFFMGFVVNFQCNAHFTCILIAFLLLPLLSIHVQSK